MRCTRRSIKRSSRWSRQGRCSLLSRRKQSDLSARSLERSRSSSREYNARDKQSLCRVIVTSIYHLAKNHYLLAGLPWHKIIACYSLIADLFVGKKILQLETDPSFRGLAFVIFETDDRLGRFSFSTVVCKLLNNIEVASHARGRGNKRVCTSMCDCQTQWNNTLRCIREQCNAIYVIAESFLCHSRGESLVAASSVSRTNIPLRRLPFRCSPFCRENLEIKLMFTFCFFVFFFNLEYLSLQMLNIKSINRGITSRLWMFL